MDWKDQLNLAIIKLDIPSIKKLLEVKGDEISPKVKLLNQAYFNQTLLSVAIFTGSLEIIKMLLKAGANADGLTDNGYAHRVPIFSLARYKYKNSDDFEKILDLLLKYKVDINGYGTNLISALDDLCNFSEPTYFSSITKCISYLFQKGINANIQPVLPFRTFLNSIKDVETKLKQDSKDNLKLRQKRIDFYLKITILFISYGLNPYMNSYDGLNIFKHILNIKSSIQTPYILEIYSKIQELLVYSKDIFQGCKEDNKEIITAISNAFKIDQTKPLNEICDCILNIIKNKDYISFEEILEKRKELNKLENCSNEYSIFGTDLNEYPKSDIIIFKDNKVDYCFHISEIPNLLRTQKNPYTNSDISLKDIQNLVKKLNIKPKSELTLEDAIDLFESKNTIPFDYSVYFDILKRLINPINPYLQLDKIEKCKGVLLNYLIDKIKVYYPSGNLPKLQGGINIPSYFTLYRYKILTTCLFAIKNEGMNVNTLAFLLSETFDLQFLSERIEEMLKEDYGYSLDNSKLLIQESNFNQLTNIFVTKDGQEVLFSPEALNSLRNLISEEGKNFKDQNDPFWIDNLWNNYLKIIISE